MRARVLSALGVGIPAIGLGASVASLVDYLAPVPQFCADSGCGAVRASAWSHPLGVPMPVVGIAYFAAMIILAVVDRPRLRRALAIAGAAWALLLIALQAFVIGAWCKLCMIADPAAIGGAAAVLAGAGRVRWRGVASAAATAAAFAAGLAIVLPHATEPVAVQVGKRPPLAGAEVPGQLTVIEVVDFECPFCRKLAPRLAEAIARTRAPVHVVRKMMPLSQHEHAMTAALAWCCADAQGKGDAMADALFATPVAELTPEGCEKLAARVGCDVERYRRDLPAMQARVAADVSDVRAAGVSSLPTVFIGDQRIVGAGASTDDLVAALDRARL
jgi:uncharacterized membrane protein/predicted DsbA family dithiol-disulfide isomerase